MISFVFSDQNIWHLSHNHMSRVRDAGARHGHTAVVYGQSMYVYAGMDNLHPRADMWAWHFCKHIYLFISSMKWIKLNSIPPFTKVCCKWSCGE